ncbi:riboflavin synthase subunit alpha [Clostridium polyendosporum]|uniref:Riboflavin synthase n=1 Tax=Clostridium polyendosporum TaxID=69208 RepID=A0A919VGF4_9CLOT|nr:riboflavin synthase [Clostridium polyendosporum]GIM28576.1 riboflavin synthase subunit alpha [Clostridium polyendosporum]
MFTGLIEEVGVIKSIVKGEKSAVLTIKASKVLEDVKLGDSICTNGVCLTVTSYSNNSFTVDVMAETMRRSNLGNLSPGSEVNLERAMASNGRFGGHIVSGHIDGTGKIVGYEKEDNAVWISIAALDDVLRYIVEKGSVTIDGISLTVAYVDEVLFKVSIIPHTAKETTLLKKKIGEEVNLECDVVGKYVEKLLRLGNQEKSKSKSKIDVDFLSSNGFI